MDCFVGSEEGDRDGEGARERERGGEVGREMWTWGQGDRERVRKKDNIIELHCDDDMQKHRRMP